MQLSEILNVARGRYGLDRFGDEDPLLNDVILTDLANEKHRWLAAETLCYRATKTHDLPVMANGLSTVGLDCLVIQPVEPMNVRVNYDGAWQRLEHCEQEELIRCHGPLENEPAGTPRYYYHRLGTSLDNQRIIEVFPGVAAQVDGGFKIDCYVYPSLMSADTATPAISPAEHTRLIPAICWGMAEVQFSRGQASAALVSYWEAQARQAAAELKRVIDANRRTQPRQVLYSDPYG
jgi:hypothetical protein